MKTIFVSWNTNSFRGLGMEIFKKEKYRFQDRFDSIKKTLDYFIVTKQVAIFGLQELEDSMILELQEYFESRGFICIRTKYNPDKMSQNFMFAYNAELYTCLEKQQIYLTETGEPAISDHEPTPEELRKHNLDNDFARSAQKITLRDQEDKIFVIVNTHFALSNKHKLLAVQKLCEQLSEEKMPLVVFGDFNQFDKSKYNTLYNEQIEIFRMNGFYWMSECLGEENPGATFLPYPYDVLHLLPTEAREQYNLMVKTFSETKKDLNPGEIDKQLKTIHDFLLQEIKLLLENGKSLLDVPYDGIFTKNLLPKESGLRCKACFFENGAHVEPPPSREEINRRATDLYTSEAECPYPSDHFPVLATFTT